MISVEDNYVVMTAEEISKRETLQAELHLLQKQIEQEKKDENDARVGLKKKLQQHCEHINRNIDDLRAQILILRSERSV